MITPIGQAQTPLYDEILRKLETRIGINQFVGFAVVYRAFQMLKELYTTFPLIEKKVSTWSGVASGASIGFSFVSGIGCLLTTRGDSQRLINGIVALIIQQLFFRWIKNLSAASFAKELPPFITDLTEQVRQEPRRYVGVDRYVNQLITALNRAEKRNAILVAPAGVGKTAIVEELARRIIEGEIPNFRVKRILSLNMTDLLADTHYAGTQERRLQQLFEYLEKDGSTAVFVDEIHTVMGAGLHGLGSHNDVSNALKGHLSRKGLSMIGATTPEEYQQAIAPNQAFARRFNKIEVPRPTINTCYHMICAQKEYYEQHYPRLTLTEDAFKAAAFFAGRDQGRLPDSAADLIDNTCSAVNTDYKEEAVRSVTAQDVAHFHATQQNRFTSQQLLGHFNALTQQCPNFFTLAPAL